MIFPYLGSPRLRSLHISNLPELPLPFLEAVPFHGTENSSFEFDKKELHTPILSLLVRGSAKAG